MSSAFTDYLLSTRLAFSGVFLVFLLIALELGRLIGLFHRRRKGDIADDGMKLVVASILGLLGFVLALNLSNASSRFDRRIASTLEEVNAIGTAQLQASALAGDAPGGISDNLKTYLALRHDYIRVGRDLPELARITTETAQLQSRIWVQLTALLHSNPSPATSSLMNAINSAFDASTSMRFAMEFRVPTRVIWLLLIISLLGMAAVGYQLGLTRRSERSPGIILSILWCSLVTEIIDFGSARIWTFRTDTSAYEWALAAMADAPPAPEPLDH